MRYIVLMIVLLSAGIASAQTTQPAVQPAAQLPAGFEMRATQAFANSEWKTALPMLEKVLAASPNNPEKQQMIGEYIRVCKKNIADPAAAAKFDPKSVLTNPNDPPTAPGKRYVHPKPVPGQVLEMSIKQLANFDYDSEHGGNIPADVQALSGAKVRLNGFMIPLDQAENITNFALVPSLLSCCFGQPPTLQHTIMVRVPAGHAVDYFPDEIVCEGTLTVQERKDDEFIVSVFELDATSVKPKAP